MVTPIATPLLHVARDDAEHEPVAESAHAQQLPQLVAHVLARRHHVRAQETLAQRSGMEKLNQGGAKRAKECLNMISRSLGASLNAIPSLGGR